MNALIIGLGSIANRHISAIKELDPNADIYALRSAQSDIKFGVTNIFDLSQIPSKIDFIIISNPTNLHLQTISSMTSAGAPLMIEKPPVHTLNGIASLMEKIREDNTFTYVACNMRFHPCIGFLKQHLDKSAAKINEVNVYCGSYLPDWRPDKDFRAIYSANKNMGGGVHLDLFHEIDYTCWLFGFPESSACFNSSKSSLDIDAEDYANFIFKYPSFNASIILNYYRRIPKRSIEILFEDSTWYVDLINCTITVDDNTIVFSCPEFKIADTYLKQMEYFIDHINNGIQPMNTFAESLQILKLTLQDG